MKKERNAMTVEKKQQKLLEKEVHLINQTKNTCSSVNWNMFMYFL